MKVASIVSTPTSCTDDGRALGLEWMLFLNDHGGRSLWHGGPGHPDHGVKCASEQAAKDKAASLGYVVLGTAWQ